jgi:hypothetical protein
MDRRKAVNLFTGLRQAAPRPSQTALRPVGFRVEMFFSWTGFTGFTGLGNMSGLQIILLILLILSKTTGPYGDELRAWRLEWKRALPR